MIIYILLFLWKIIDNIFNIYYYPGYERKFINFLLNIDNGVVQAQITFWQKVADFKVWRKLWWIRQKQNWKDFTWFCWYWYYEILIMYCKFRKQLAIMYFNNLTDIEIWNHKRVWRNYMKFRERQLFYIQLRCLIGIYFYGVILRNRNWEFQVHLMFLYFLVDKLYVFYYFFFLRFTFRLAWRYEVKPLIRLYSSYIYCDILLTWECLIKLELPYWYLYLKYCIKSKWINFKRFKVVYKIWIYCGYFRFKIHKRYTIIALKIFIYISCRILLNVLDIITLGSLTKIKLKLLDFFWVKIKKNQWDLILQNYYKKNSEKIYKRGEEERKQFLNVMAKYREELYILRKRDIIKEIVEEDLEKKNQKK